jgi:ubiquinone/menaquinone biosynthesis C-methylase UbiE
MSGFAGICRGGTACLVGCDLFSLATVAIRLTGVTDMASNQLDRTDARRRRREFYIRTVRRAASHMGGRVDRRVERALLERAWLGRSAERLEGYLVDNYQNPVINVQSILARHEFIRELGVDQADLCEDELRWAAHKHQELRRRQQDLQRQHGTDFAGLKTSGVWGPVYDEVMGDADRFADAWTEALQGQPSGALSLVEAACGSANDYRYLVRYGLGPPLSYTGFDLTRTNIENCRRMFPGVDFRVGDVQSIDAHDDSYDWAVVHDLLEHLSPAAMERAVQELCRVARRGVLISFFCMRDVPEHRIQPKGTYHWNELSRDRVEELFARHCSDIGWVHIHPYLVDRYNVTNYYNRRAWTMIARK